MVDLNEYLGSIASSISEARMISDLKSVEIAEKFAQHNLLKHFSIPRFKAQNIELTIPVAIGALENNYKKEYEPINNVEFSSQTYGILKDITKQKSFERELSKNVKFLINNEIEVLEKEIKARNEQEKALEDYSKSISGKFLDLYFEKKKKEGVVAKLYNVMKTFLKPINREVFAVKTIDGLEKAYGISISERKDKEKIMSIIREEISVLEKERLSSKDREDELVYYSKELLDRFSERVIRKTATFFNVDKDLKDIVSKLNAEIFSTGNFIGAQLFYEQMILFLNGIEGQLTTIFTIKDPSKRYSFSQELSVLLQKLEEGNSVEESTKEYAEVFIDRCLSFYKEKVEENVIISKLNKTLASFIQEREVENQKPKVIVESHKLQEVRPENVIQIKMTLSEEGMEWHTSENEKGEVSTQLLPE